MLLLLLTKILYPKIRATSDILTSLSLFIFRRQSYLFFQNFPKMPRVATNNAANTPVKMDTDAAAAAPAAVAGAENGTAAKPKPDWLSKIQEGGIKKPPKDVLKRRRNFRLGRMVAPKQPVCALQELIRQERVDIK